ncbi:MAG: hypothetical protein IKO06_06775 [Alphaproteobacteria bacterium]|nr:hypothetical protein [Alphaproteobacteria bacterium]
MKNIDIKNIDCCAALVMTKNVQSGRSMIEMLGVLAIIGVLSVGGIAGYSKAMTKYRINKTIEQISLISQNIRTFFATQGSYKGITVEVSDGDGGAYDTFPVLKKAKLIPDEVWNGEELQNPFGGNYWLNSYNSYEDFTISMSNIPEEVCIELLTKDWGNISSGFIGLSTVNVNSMPSLELDTGCEETSSNSEFIACIGENIGIPLPLDKATDACSIHYGRIIFKYGR